MKTRRRRIRGDRGGEGGYVLAWISLMLVILVAFAGLAVDVGNWYFVASREQKAADAGSLAGAVFLPSNLPQGQTTGLQVTNVNGFSASQGDTITIVQGSQPNQLRVTISRTVTNHFLGLLGVDTTTVTRTAVAEFQGPIPMGSAESWLGTDPDTPGHDPDFWINVAAPNATKVSGDRFTAKVCPNTVTNCDSAQNPDNLEYATNGYSFAVRIGSVEAGKDLVFEVWDAEFAYVGDHCEVAGAFPTAAQLTTLSGLNPPGAPAGYYADANPRYAGGDAGAQANWCTGDVDIQGRNMITTFIVRQPDDTPFDDFDNPVISTATCQPMQTPAYNLAVAPNIFQRLHPSDGQSDGDAVYNPNNNFAAGGLTFAESFRRWVTVCRVPSGQAVAGDYILQIRTNAAQGSPLVYGSGIATGGHNRMSIRAGFRPPGGGALTGATINLFGNGKLPIYANNTAANTTFFLARVLPSGGDRVLMVPLFDMGDAAAAGTLTLIGPGGAPWTNCIFHRDFGASVVAPNCQLTGVSGGAGYNGRIATIEAPIPASYTCNPSVATACWFKILAQFPTGVQDTTTWQAFILGDPVRLIE